MIPNLTGCCRPNLYRAATLAAFLSVMLVGCDRSGSSSASSSSGSSAQTSHEGQGEPVSADPKFELAVTLNGQSLTIPVQALSIFQSKPVEGNSKKKVEPQGFELAGQDLMLAGTLPEGLEIAPQRKFQQLVGQPLQVRRAGGDPTFTRLSKIKLSDGTVYRAESGTLAIDRAFYSGERYAGVSGKVNLVLQQIKLGDTEDPNNKGDQTIGEPVNVTGTFAAKADSFPFEKM